MDESTGSFTSNDSRDGVLAEQNPKNDRREERLVATIKLQWEEENSRKTQTLFLVKRFWEKSRYSLYIGRDPNYQCDIRIGDARVAWRHGEIIFKPQNGCFYLRSVSDSDPITLYRDNEERESVSHQGVPLKEGDTLEFGGDTKGEKHPRPEGTQPSRTSIWMWISSRFQGKQEPVLEEDSQVPINEKKGLKVTIEEITVNNEQKENDQQDDLVSIHNVSDQVISHLEIDPIERLDTQEKVAPTLLWKRLVASAIDLIISLLVAFILVSSTFLLIQWLQPTYKWLGLLNNPLFYTFLVLLSFMLYPATWGSPLDQVSLGKWCLGIRVTDPEGRRISFSQATKRWLTQPVLISIYLYALWFLIAYFFIPDLLKGLSHNLSDDLAQDDSSLYRSLLLGSVLILVFLVVLTKIILDFIMLPLKKKEYSVRDWITKTRLQQGKAGVPRLTARLVVLGLIALSLLNIFLIQKYQINQEAQNHYQTGHYWSQKGDYFTATLYYEWAITLNPKLIEAYDERGYAFQQYASRSGEVKHLDKAIADYTQAIALTPKRSFQKIAEYYYKSGSAYLAWNKFSEAIKEFDNAIEKYPNYAYAYNDRGYANSQLNQKEEAIKDYTQAIAIDPKYALAYNNRGNTYLELGSKDPDRRDKAIEDYTQAIKIDPNYADAYTNRGTAYLESKDPDRKNKAIADHNQVIKLCNGCSFAYYNRGNAYLKLGEKENAIADYTQAITIKTNKNVWGNANSSYFGLPSAYNNRGNAYSDLGDTKKAIEDYTSAINLKPNFAYAYNNRGNAYLDLGDAKKAIADYNRAIAIDPKYALAYKNRGDAYLKLGEKAAAKKDFQTAAKLYQQQGKTADSKDALKRSQDIE